VLVGPVALGAWAASAERAALVVQRVRPRVRPAVLKALVVRSAKAARSEA
jgi:hypothetical protein